MNRLGIESLNAGAPDLRLTGDQTQRGGTYTQRRRARWLAAVSWDPTLDPC